MRLSLAMVRIILSTDKLYYKELGRPVNQALIREGAYEYDKTTGWATLSPKGQAARAALQAVADAGVTLT